MDATDNERCSFTKARGSPILLGVRTFLGRDRVRAVEVRGVRLGAGNERPSLDRNLKGLKQIGVDIPWEGVWTQVPSEE